MSKNIITGDIDHKTISLKTSVKKRAVSVFMAGVLATSSLCMPMIAIAADNGKSSDKIEVKAQKSESKKEKETKEATEDKQEQKKVEIKEDTAVTEEDEEPSSKQEDKLADEDKKEAVTTTQKTEEAKQDPEVVDNGFADLITTATELLNSVHVGKAESGSYVDDKTYQSLSDAIIIANEAKGTEDDVIALQAAIDEFKMNIKVVEDTAAEQQPTSEEKQNPQEDKPNNPIIDNKSNELKNLKASLDKASSILDKYVNLISDKDGAELKDGVKFTTSENYEALKNARESAKYVCENGGDFTGTKEKLDYEISSFEMNLIQNNDISDLRECTKEANDKFMNTPIYISADGSGVEDGCRYISPEDKYLLDKIKSLIQENENIISNKNSYTDIQINSQVEKTRNLISKLDSVIKIKDSLQEAYEGDSFESTIDSTFIPHHYTQNLTTEKFIASIGESCRQIAKKHDLYASVMIAQAILESGSGNSGLAKKDHNLFGIKGSWTDEKGESHSSSYATNEDNGSGKLYSINASFRSYNSNSDSLNDYAKLLDEHYEGVKKSEVSSPVEVAKNLQGVYATSTSYAESIAGLIKTYNLTRFDKDLNYKIKGEINDPKTGARELKMEDYSNLLSEATKYLDTDYVWGGSNPSTGFDCSGLVQYCYKNTLGIDLSRTTYTQQHQGVEVPLDDLRMGDLLFFNNKSEGTHHVAMYIGDGYYIHAPETGDVVKITAMEDYMPSFAKRVINFEEKK